MKHPLRFASLAISALLFCAWCAGQSGTTVISKSGAPAVTFGNPLGVLTTGQASMEEIIAGSPATVSVVIQGCMRGGTCTTLDTYTTVANAIRTPTISTVYDYFSVAASWTGGTNVSVTINTTLTTASSGSGGGTPGGSDTQVQFNDANAFGGDAAFTFDKVSKGVHLYGTNVGQAANSPALDVAPAIAENDPWGVSSLVTYVGTTDVTGTSKALAYYSQVVNSSGHTIGTAAGLFVDTNFADGGDPITNNNGLLIASQPGAGITNNYAIHVLDQGMGPADYAIKVDGGQNDLGPGTTRAGSFISEGTTFATNNGCGETTNLVGGAEAGTIHTSGSTSCTTIVTMGNSATAPHGWSCWAHDLTTTEDYNNPRTSSNATTLTIVTGTIASGDTLEFGCIGY
jgi:hypothetical protein